MRQSAILLLVVCCISFVVDVSLANDEHEHHSGSSVIVVHKEKEQEKEKEKDPHSNPIVCIHNGCLCGIICAEHDGYTKTKYDAFMGIPYAKAPVGDLRFAVSTF